ncbi:MAG: hypothetical protein E6G19_11170 [Actinobacteria bacterium]|nr:MAG: hypothetical protein E6G19_11170 [Actinomycetota bacterium]
MPSTSRLLAVFAIVGGLAVYASLNSTAATGPDFIRVTDRQFGYTRVDVGRRGLTPGDQEIIYDKLFNRKITTKPIGTARFICTFMTGRTRMCTATVALPKGELVASGTVRFRQFFDLAIIGGTGLYNNARGTLTIIRTTRSPRPIRELLYFRLTG